MRLIVTFFFASAVSADANIGATFKVVAPTWVVHRQHIQNRILDVSQQCIADTNALYGNQGLANALAAWEAESTQTACASDSSSTTIECSLDSTTFSSHADLVAACEQAGGENIFLEYGLDCEFSFQDTDYGFIIDFKNIPDCLAAPSCSADDANEVSTLLNQLEILTEDALMVSDDIQCTASGSGGGADSGTAVSTISLASGGVASTAAPTTSPASDGVASTADPTTSTSDGVVSIADPPTAFDGVASTADPADDSTTTTVPSGHSTTTTGPTGGDGRDDPTSSAYNKFKTSILGPMSVALVAVASFFA